MSVTVEQVREWVKEWPTASGIKVTHREEDTKVRGGKTKLVQGDFRSAHTLVDLRELSQARNPKERLYAQLAAWRYKYSEIFGAEDDV